MTTKKTFTADQFQPGKFKTAAEKARLANLFLEFIASDFDREMWFANPSLYQWLRNAYMFIAHYNIEGFYEERFATPAHRVQTFKQIQGDQFIPDDPERDGDLLTAVQNYVKEAGLVDRYESRLAHSQYVSSTQRLLQLIRFFPLEAANFLAQVQAEEAAKVAESMTEEA